MSLRYGDKTRVGNQVATGGRRQASLGSSQSPYEEIFIAPGTWTWPGNVTHVEVLLVGGGGGSGSTSAPPRPATNRSGSGGGGGVRMVYDIPVSAPVPITVGAGGTGGTFPLGSGGAGGDSAFGPISPPIPPSTYKVGGGGGGSTDGLAPATPNMSAPPDGGGAGGRSLRYGNVIASGGTYGMPNYPLPAADPSSPLVYDGSGAGALTPGTTQSGGLGKWGYGFGGGNKFAMYFGGGEVLTEGAMQAGAANTGRGASGGFSGGFNASGVAGGSGIVIVRWWE